VLTLNRHSGADTQLMTSSLQAKRNPSSGRGLSWG
jgi:hypothetical protein